MVVGDFVLNLSDSESEGEGRTSSTDLVLTTGLPFEAALIADCDREAAERGLSRLTEPNSPLSVCQELVCEPDRDSM